MSYSISSTIEFCDCNIENPEKECYISESVILATCEEKPPFGLSTSVIHRKCGKYIDPSLFMAWFRKNRDLWISDEYDLKYR
jgi:hypothetical protein